MPPSEDRAFILQEAILRDGQLSDDAVELVGAHIVFMV